MGEMSIPDADDSGRLVEPFIEQARKRLEGEPDRRMVGRVPKDADHDEWQGTSLHTAGQIFGPFLLGRPFLTRPHVKIGLTACAVALPSIMIAVLTAVAGMISEAQLEVILGSLCLLFAVGPVGGAITSMINSGKHPDDHWVLTSPRPGRYSPEQTRRDFLIAGDEAHLARHSAAALWALQAGRESRTWRSNTLTDWRTRVDLRTEAAETIRAAGALQDLRGALGDSPIYLDDEAQAKWRDDYTAYQAGLSSLRERVEQQVALRMAVEAIGRQLDTPAGERAAMVDRITATIPGSELAVENLAEINTQSADLLALLSLQSPSIEAVDNRTSAPNDGESAAAQAAERPLRHGD